MRNVAAVTFMTDVRELKSGLVLFRRGDVKHCNWYCRIKIPGQSRYKVISLKTDDPHEALEIALLHEQDIGFRVRHDVPIFEKSFAEVAQEYLAHQREAAEIGQITIGRWKIVDSYIRLHLIPYLGNIRITRIGEDKWNHYPIWRKKNGNSMDGNGARDGTIRQEMSTFRAIMGFAVSKGYISERQVPRGRLLRDRGRREEFTPKEYRTLLTKARQWIEQSRKANDRWNRSMAYNFILVMTNTGMRTIEARNLRWRDMDVRTDQIGRQFVCMNVRGKGKHRELVAATNVADYLDRIRKLARQITSVDTQMNSSDYVFINRFGKPANRLYQSMIGCLLEDSELLYSASGSRRSTYCFRHTYATFRLRNGVDVYMLAKQMGTSVKMIEDYYGHITPSDDAARILQGMPGWQSFP